MAVQRQACPPRPAGEVGRSRRLAGILPVNVEFNPGAGRLDIVDFAVGGAALPPDVLTDANWQRAMSFIIGDPSVRVGVTGFTDCTGSTTENLSLRKERTATLVSALPPAVRAKILFNFVAGTTDYLDTNLTPEGRARNRSARLSFKSVPPSGKDSCDLLPKASNLDEYLFLVRCLETRLGLTTTRDAPTALSVLRQIYYGSAAWSQSSIFVWDGVITSRPWSSGTDPTAQLHPPLMKALQDSQVVEGTDIGHVLTGLDAMLAPGIVTIPRVNLVTDVPNEDWATWAGDVGSAATEWAYATWMSNPIKPEAAFAKLASDPDLIGDVDSFAIRASSFGAAPPPAQLMRGIRLNAPLSELLLQYFRLSGTALAAARGGRFQNFVEAYGGIVVNKKITNRAALIARLRPSVEKFAGRLAFLKVATGPNPPPGAPMMTNLLATASEEMTARFVDWLAARL